MSKNHKKLPDTINGDKFYSATSIQTPLIVAITDAGFVAVTLAAACKGFHVSTRNGSDWLVSDVSAGTTYATLKSGIFFDVAGEAADIVFYVKATLDTDLEVLPFD